MDWSFIINTLITFIFGGGILMWVTLKEKKGQEREKTAQEHEHTRQEKIDTLTDEFKYLKERTEFAEKHINEMHPKMVWMQEKLEELADRAIFAENHICFNTPCKKRKPALGTYRGCKKKEVIEGGDNNGEIA